MNANDIVDIKSQIDLPTFPWVWVVVGIVIFALVVLMYFLSRKKALVQQTSDLKMDESPKAKAMRLLNDIKQQGLIEQGRVKEYYDGVSDIIRQLIEEVYTINATHMSSEEFFAFLMSNTQLPDSLQKILKDMLAQADLVKFAKHMPNQQEANDYWHIAINVVEKVDGI